MKKKTNKWLKCLTAGVLAVAVFAQTATAGWVDDWMTNSTSPGSFAGEKRGYFTGGGFSARWRTGTEPLVTVTSPSFKAGCGGIDVMMGGFGFVNADQLVAKLQTILSAAPAVAFDMALKAYCPQCSETIKAVNAVVDRLNGLQLNDCAAAKGAVAVMADPFVKGTRLEEQASVAKTEAWTSTGLGQLYSETMKSGERIAKAWNGAGSTPEAKAAQQSIIDQLSGCPAELKKLVGVDGSGGGSLLDRLGASHGLNSDYIEQVRGFVGDVYIVSPTDSNGSFKAISVEPCTENKSASIEDLTKGLLAAKKIGPATSPDLRAAGCYIPNESTGKLEKWVGDSMRRVAKQLKERKPLSKQEDAFIGADGGLGVGLLLKTAVPQNIEEAIIQKTTKIVANGMAYRLFFDLLTLTAPMTGTIDSMLTSGMNAVPGKDPKSCKKELVAEIFGSHALVSFKDNTVGSLNDLKIAYETAIREAMAIETLLAEYRSFNNQMADMLTKSFGLTRGAQARIAGR